MADNRSSLFSGLKNIFLEDEAKSETETPVASPVTPAPVVVSTPAVVPTGTTPTDEELKAAEARVASWSGFKNLENLKKFAAIETKLKGKISDPTALRTASFEMAEVAGVDPKFVVDEAKSAVSRVLQSLSDASDSVQKQLADIDKMEATDRKNLETQQLELEGQLQKVRERLANLSSDSANAKSNLQRQIEITQKVAGLFVEQWSPLGK